ncbi:hypothetical protein BDV38DRAFT_246586 [Aspergillus pseudotamarii]|uniref:Uncharacterized protein n=1 Tax=Aspergillus pseudotamarii TaxID=132259 RepID=A0A5N6SV27_ASPPS|nr:uncharacterized protein BDV38DRAFT_246586 [Aspergillus pseudotamarii]KAE8137641.1 hypothetical protein BDV38DRAFT_246586 [Aspergillus pseudotamarii]
MSSKRSLARRKLGGMSIYIHQTKKRKINQSTVLNPIPGGGHTPCSRTWTIRLCLADDSRSSRRWVSILLSVFNYIIMQIEIYLGKE